MYNLVGQTSDNPVGSGWAEMDGRSTHITICDYSQNFWCVGMDGQPWFQSFGYDEDHTDGWTQIDGGITQIDCGADGTDVWAVASDDTIWYRTGVT